MKALNILEVSASARGKDSVSGMLSQELIDALQARSGEIAVTRRNLADGIPLLDENWVGANFTREDKRSEDQRKALAASDALIDELRNADVLVIGAPVYNFGIPAALKAWIDMIARARVTFRYTSAGPEGLLRGKKAYLIYASGGVPAGSPADFATPYLKHVLGFVGITDVEVIAAERLNADTPAALDRARQRIADTIHTRKARDDRAA